MANKGHENLVPQNKRTKEEQRAIARKGGIASGEARRERRALKDELLLMLSDSDTQEKMCLALIRQAQRGNTKAFEIVRDTVGEKPVERVETSQNVGEVASDIEIYMTARRITNAEPDRN